MLGRCPQKSRPLRRKAVAVVKIGQGSSYFCSSLSFLKSKLISHLFVRIPSDAVEKPAHGSGSRIVTLTFINVHY